MDITNIGLFIIIMFKNIINKLYSCFGYKYSKMKKTDTVINLRFSNAKNDDFYKVNQLLYQPYSNPSTVIEVEGKDGIKEFIEGKVMFPNDDELNIN